MTTGSSKDERRKQRLASIQRDINKLVEAESVLAKDILETQGERSSLIQTMFGTREDSLSLTLEELKLEEQRTNGLRQQAELSIQYSEQVLKRTGLTQDEIDLEKEVIANLDSEIDRLDKILKKHGETEAELLKKLKLQKASDDLWGSIAIKIGLSAKQSQSLLGKMINMVANMKDMVKQAGSITQGVKAMASSFFSVFGVVNILSSLIVGMFKAALEFIFASSKAMASFSAISGTAGEMAHQMGEGINFAAGVDIKEVGSAAEALAQNFTEFVDHADAGKIAGVAAELETLRIDAGTSGKMLGLLTQAMGKTRKQALHTMKGLASAARMVGKTPQQMTKDFVEAAKTMMKYGPNMEKVLMDLQGTSKKTGVELNSLLGIAKGFDTFSDAADKVQQLNAILGGDYFNTIEMMDMNENQRLQTLQKVLQMQGKTFDQMERREIQALAKAMGSDEQQLAQLMGASTEEANAAAAAATKEAAAQSKYNKMLSSTVDLLRRFELLFASIFRNPKMVEAMSGLIFQFFEMIKKNKDLIMQGMMGIATAMATLMDMIREDPELVEKLIKGFLLMTLVVAPLARVFHAVYLAGAALFGFLFKVPKRIAGVWKAIFRPGGWMDGILLRFMYFFEWLGKIFRRFTGFIGNVGRKIAGFAGWIRALGTKAVGWLLMVFDFGYWVNKMLPNANVFSGSIKKKIGALAGAVIEMFTGGMVSGKGVMDWVEHLLTSIEETVMEWANSDNPIVKAFGHIVGFIGSILGSMWNLVFSAFQGIGKVVSWVLSPLETLKSIAEWFEGVEWGLMFDLMVPGFREGASKIMEGFFQGWKDFKAKVLDIGGAVKDAWDSLWSGSPLDSPQGVGGKTGTGIMTGLLKAVGRMMNPVKAAFAPLWKIATAGLPEKFQAIASTVVGIGRAFREMPGRIVTDFAYGMESFLVPASNLKNPDAPIRVIREAAKYQKEVASNKDNVDGLKEILKLSQGNAAAAGAGAPVQVNLELGGRLLDSYILDVNKNEFRRKTGFRTS